jgi:TPR repeat protein
MTKKMHWFRLFVVFFSASACMLTTALAAESAQSGNLLRDDVAVARRSGNWAPVLRDLQAQIDKRSDPIYETALAGMQFQGLGVAPDPARIVALLKSAAEKGEPLAMTHLGVLYARGFGVDKDLAKASAWHRRAAELGVSEAQYNLGQLYHTVGIGDGKGPDVAQAASWYRKAADQGFAMASLNLAALMLQGAGVEKDVDKAIALMRKAADAGESAAQTNLGIIYMSGFDGRPRDLSQAYYFLTLASRQDTRGICLPAALWVAARKGEGFQGVSSEWVVRNELARQSCMVTNQQAVNLLAKLEDLATKYPELQTLRANAQEASAAFMAKRQFLDESITSADVTAPTGRSEMGFLRGPTDWVVFKTSGEGEGVAYSETRPSGQSGDNWQEMATFRRFDRLRYAQADEHMRPLLDGLGKACAKGWMTHGVFSGEERGYPTLVMTAYCDESPSHRSETHFVKVVQGKEAFYEWHAIHRGAVGDAYQRSDDFKQLNMTFAQWLKNQLVCDQKAAAGAPSSCPTGFPPRQAKP